MTKSFPNFIQRGQSSCGLACIKIIAKHYGKIIDMSAYHVNMTDKGVSIYDLCEMSENIGFRASAYDLKPIELEVIKKPLIIHWKENHFVVLYKIKKEVFYISDPAKGLTIYEKEEFLSNWIGDDSKGKVIALETTDKFKKSKGNKANYLSAIEFLFRHLNPYSGSLRQLLLVMMIIAFIYASFPFITRSIIDVGIAGNDLDFITIILVANISLLLFKSIGEWIKASISLHIASRIKISIITDYLIKIFSLPVSFIDRMLLGDIIQRSKDQERIQEFISNSAISIVMSLMIIAIYGVILYVFDSILFYIFIVCTILYVMWIMLFYGIRKKMDIKYYELMGENQSTWIEILKNFEDIKLNGYSLNRRWKWEKVQGALYHIGIKMLNIDRIQELGADFINGIKDIGLTFYGAYLVIKGEMTLGTLISIQFIIGQLGSPVMELVNFVKSAQSAFISFLRVSEINNMPEEQEGKEHLVNDPASLDGNIVFRNVNFRYEGTNINVLNNISFLIPSKKITAIVGTSGCGKTTILKLLTKVYTGYFGDIYLGKNNLRNMENNFMRKKMGVVLQDSSLYKDTILNNIIMSDEQNHNIETVEEVLNMVNLRNEIYRLPKALQTELSEGGKGLSQGQKQRLLLARALYKKPKFLILDETTNAIDSISENRILNVFTKMLKEQTIILVSHKLSTIKCADFIIAIDRGTVVDSGTYKELVEKKTFFYNLFKEQI